MPWAQYIFRSEVVFQVLMNPVKQVYNKKGTLPFQRSSNEGGLSFLSCPSEPTQQLTLGKCREAEG